CWWRRLSRGPATGCYIHLIEHVEFSILQSQLETDRASKRSGVVRSAVRDARSERRAVAIQTAYSAAGNPDVGVGEPSRRRANAFQHLRRINPDTAGDVRIVRQARRADQVGHRKGPPCREM